MPYALCPTPYAVALYPMFNISPELFLCFEISKLRNYLRKIPNAIRPMPYALSL